MNVRAVYVYTENVDSDGDIAEVPVLTSLQRVTNESVHSMTKKTVSALQTSLTRPEALITGKKDFPILCPGCRSDGSTVPPGSGVLGNDSSTLANLVTRRRSRLDTGIIEMILSCKLNHKLIPSEIPEISADAISDHIPIRLRNPEMKAELQPLDVDPQFNNGESDLDGDGI